MMLFRRIARAVQNGFIATATPTAANPGLSAALSKRTRIKMTTVIELLKANHAFREEVMQHLGLPPQLMFPNGMDDNLFIGEIDFDITKDILLQNVYLPETAREDVKLFFKLVGEQVVDMTVAYYETE